jgi:hypothetical protein
MEDTRLNFPQYMWVEPNQAGESVSADVRRLCISEKERQIYNYYVRGVQPVFHYPIITYTQTWEYPVSAVSFDGVETGGGTVDTKVSFAVLKALGCPFDFAVDDWQFLDCGTEASMRYSSSIDKSTLQMTYVQTWEGAVVIDDNFYSSDPSKRWFPGGGTYGEAEPEGGGGQEGGGGEG